MPEVNCLASSTWTSLQPLSGEIRVAASPPFADSVSVHVRENSRRVVSVPAPLFLGHTVCAISVGVISCVSDAFIPAVQHPSKGPGDSVGLPGADSSEEPW